MAFMAGNNQLDFLVVRSRCNIVGYHLVFSVWSDDKHTATAIIRLGAELFYVV